MKGNTEGTRARDSVETTRDATLIGRKAGVAPGSEVEDMVRSASMAKMQRQAEMTCPRPSVGVTTCEFTGFSSNAYKEYGQGLHDATISLTLFNDFVGTATPFGQLQPYYASGGTFGVVVRPTSSAVGTANPQWSMTGRIFAFSPLSGGIGDASSFDVDIANASSAGLTYATA